MRIIYITRMSFSASNNYYRYCGCPACVCVCVSVRSFLRPRASRPRNIDTYVFTATRKTLLKYNIRIIVVIFAENASFRSYGVICLPRMPLSTPEPQIRILTESTRRGQDITIRDSKNASFRSYSPFVYLFRMHIPNINMRMYITIVLMNMN